MNANQRIHDSKLAHWITLFKKQSESGLPVNKWCAENGLSKNAYYYWKRLAKEVYADSVLPDIVQIETADITQTEQTQSAPLLPELHNSRKLPNLCNTHTNTVSVSCNDIRIDIGSSASDELVASLIGVIRNA